MKDKRAGLAISDTKAFGGVKFVNGVAFETNEIDKAIGLVAKPHGATNYTAVGTTIQQRASDVSLFKDAGICGVMTASALGRVTEVLSRLRDGATHSRR